MSSMCCYHRAEFATKLLESAGPRFAGPIAILRNWTFCLFYVMAELWGSVVVSLLFWGFANQVCKLIFSCGPLRRTSGCIFPMCACAIMCAVLRGIVRCLPRSPCLQLIRAMTESQQNHSIAAS